MKTIDRLIEASTEFVCERWGTGEAVVDLYAPVTRLDGKVWIHPTWAHEASGEAIRRRATRIWRVKGSLWNPQAFTLVYAVDAIERAGKNRAAA